MVFAYRLIAVDLLRIVGVRTRIVSVSSSAVGLAQAAVRRHVFAPAALVPTAVATPGVGAGTAAFDNGYDFPRGVDASETDAGRTLAPIPAVVRPQAAAVPIAAAAFGAGRRGQRHRHGYSAAGKAAGRADIIAGFVARTPAILVGIARRARSRP
jgi:hypothetical protein